MSYALITGASKGIGRAIAENLAKRNINLLLVARSEGLLKEIAEELAVTYNIQAHYLAVDLSLSAASQHITNWVSENNFAVNILVNNAGYGLSGSFTKYSYQQHIDMMQVNMTVPVQLTYLLLPILQKQPASYILNIASSAAYQAVPGLSLYAATKSFVLSFSRGLKYELRNTNVSVTVACPGATDTEFAHRADVTTAKAKKLAEQFNMQPSVVAELAINAMFAKKSEVVTGFVNKLNLFLTWLLPKKILEKAAADIYGL
jgi:short-subunit dehydrogenase